MIYTSYFDKIKDLPKNVTPIAICIKAPAWYEGLQYKKLAPKQEFFSVWKKTHNNDYYKMHFQEEVLSKLEPFEVVDELHKMVREGDAALICHEKPEGFCHRHLVAEWLRKGGFKCKEYSK